MCMAIGEFCPGRVLETAGLLISKLKTDRSSGYIAIVNRENNRMLLHAQIGDCPAEKAERYMKFSLEKAMRVSKSGETSSWMTRNPDKDQYGGGISAGKYAIGFSGLPEDRDEALVTALAYKLELIDVREAYHIGSLSGNKHIKDLIS